MTAAEGRRLFLTMPDHPGARVVLRTTCELAEVGRSPKEAIEDLFMGAASIAVAVATDDEELFGESLEEVAGVFGRAAERAFREFVAILTAPPPGGGS